MYKIYSNNDELIYEAGDNVRDCVILAMQEGISLAHARLCDQDLSDLSLPGIDLTRANLRNTNFSDCELDGADFSHAALLNTNFLSCHLLDAVFLGTISACDFTNAQMASVNFDHTLVKCCDFTRAELSYHTEEEFVSTWSAVQAEFRNCDFSTSSMRNGFIHTHNSKFFECNFAGQKLEGFIPCSLNNCHF